VTVWTDLFSFNTDTDGELLLNW